jgi:hypothetical protein
MPRSTSDSGTGFRVEAEVSVLPFHLKLKAGSPNIIGSGGVRG